jgi:hypothetical protein
MSYKPLFLQGIREKTTQPINDKKNRMINPEEFLKENFKSESKHEGKINKTLRRKTIYNIERINM